MPSDLLTPVVPSKDLHAYFQALLSEVRFAPARDMLRTIWAAYPNPDKHFIREFQTTHFDARLWELYIFALGHFNGYKVSRPAEAPDFLFEVDGLEVWIEATTANPSEKYGPPKSAETLDESLHEMREIVPIRFAGPLTAKLNKRYWEQHHVAGRPIVIAIGDFAEQSIFRSAGSGLLRYLYATDTVVVSRSNEPVKVQHQNIARHTHGAKTIPSGFFHLPNAEYVSAVIFSNEGTLPKFSRMAFDFAKYPFVRFVRTGLCVDQGEGQRFGKGFGFLVGDVDEDWGMGVHVYHNPNALHAIPLDFFGGIDSQYWVENGEIDGEVREFSPIYSVTHFFEAKPGESSIAYRDDELRARAKQEALTIEEAIRGDPEYLAWHDSRLD